uniref:Uncharacterized protein n=1 Tax=uncultured marine virus TaxID=186617 RepID=A0A0F7L796_9VIRU|nr:hypothetical protein Haur_0541 [uncultured marine virus]
MSRRARCRLSACPTSRFSERSTSRTCERSGQTGSAYADTTGKSLSRTGGRHLTTSPCLIVCSDLTRSSLRVSYENARQSRAAGARVGLCGDPARGTGRNHSGGGRPDQNRFAAHCRERNRTREAPDGRAEKPAPRELAVVDRGRNRCLDIDGEQLVEGVRTRRPVSSDRQPEPDGDLYPRRGGRARRRDREGQPTR